MICHRWPAYEELLDRARFRAARQLALARGVAMLGLWFQELEQGKTGVPEGGRAAARMWS
jgi:hypothetical protein